MKRAFVFDADGVICVGRSFSVSLELSLQELQHLLLQRLDFQS